MIIDQERSGHGDLWSTLSNQYYHHVPSMYDLIIYLQIRKVSHIFFLVHSNHTVIRFVCQQPLDHPGARLRIATSPHAFCLTRRRWEVNCWWQPEIRLEHQVEVGSLSHGLKGFIHWKVVSRISSINSISVSCDWLWIAYPQKNLETMGWRWIAIRHYVIISIHSWEHQESIGHGFTPFCFLERWSQYWICKRLIWTLLLGHSKCYPPFRLLIYWTRQDITSSHSESLSSTTSLMLQNWWNRKQFMDRFSQTPRKMLKWLFLFVPRSMVISLLGGLFEDPGPAEFAAGTNWSIGTTQAIPRGGGVERVGQLAAQSEGWLARSKPFWWCSSWNK